MWQLAEDLTGPCTERCAHPGHGKPQLLHVLVRQVVLPSVRPSQVNFSEQIVPSLLLESRRDGARATGPQHQIWSRLCHRDPGLACGARSAAGRRPILGAAFGLAAGASDVCCRGSKTLSRPSPKSSKPKRPLLYPGGPGSVRAAVAPKTWSGALHVGRRGIPLRACIMACSLSV